MFWWQSCPSSRDFLERSIKKGQIFLGNDGSTVVPIRGPEAGLVVFLSGESLVHPDRLPVKGKWKWSSTQNCSPGFEIFSEVFISETCLQRWRAGFLLHTDFLPCPHHALLCVLAHLGLLVCFFLSWMFVYTLPILPVPYFC